MNKQTIKMVAYNPMTGKTEEVFPESEIALDEMQPRFLSNGKWMSVPGVSAIDVYDQWEKQLMGTPIYL